MCSINQTIEDETNSNLTDMPVFHMRTFQQINRLGCVVVGLPLNLLVIAVVCRSKQLWSSRNISWLAVTFFNLLALVQSIVELCMFQLYKRNDGSHLILCQIYSVLIGCPFALLLTGLTLAAIERYLALAHRHFHEKYATSRVTSCIFVFTIFLVTSKFLKV